jgi:hypothetical protein
MPIITALTLFTLNLVGNVIMHCFHIRTAVNVADLPPTELLHNVVDEYRDRQSNNVMPTVDNFA